MMTYPRAEGAAGECKEETHTLLAVAFDRGRAHLATRHLEGGKRRERTAPLREDGCRPLLERRNAGCRGAAAASSRQNPPSVASRRCCGPRLAQRAREARKGGGDPAPRRRAMDDGARNAADGAMAAAERASSSALTMVFGCPRPFDSRRVFPKRARRCREPRRRGV